MPLNVTMVRFTFLSILLVEFGGLLFSSTAHVLNDVSSGSWDGVGFYIAVKREAVQEKLDAFHRSTSNQCGDGPRLFIPEISVLPNLHHSDYHPVYIDIGDLKSHDFDDYLKENSNPCVSVSGMEIAVTIPLLAGTPNGPPEYALALAMFYERSRGDIPKINILYPYIPVDEITLNEHSAAVINGRDEMRISFSRFNERCEPATGIVKEEFEQFILSDVQFGIPAPDYSFCERHSFENKFCSNAERIKSYVHRYSPNLCQKWTSNDPEECETEVAIENITSGFRDILLVGDEPVNILASEVLHYNFSIALKYPCQD
ncbi:hypothetical protein HOLleu_35951 [Holothuria leucospilota]|uniref:Uncharacterized protein n=1 Tax=Holothuria leucospilota TaxID=206669 RepID=A0A9Q1BFQ7_HOLLE|nr:hypothetical protein HOLleu_35951 [Holothuria leucospilota]